MKVKNNLTGEILESIDVEYSPLQRCMVYQFPNNVVLTMDYLANQKIKVYEIQHEVAFDYAGFGGHPRLTCNDCRTTLLKQPWMSLDKWQELVAKFAQDHPSEVARCYNSNLNGEWYRK